MTQSPEPTGNPAAGAAETAGAAGSGASATPAGVGPDTDAPVGPTGGSEQQPAGVVPAGRPGRRAGCVVAGIAALVTLVLLCGAATVAAVYLVRRQQAAATADGPRDEVVTTGGTDGIHFGDSRDTLTREHGLSRQAGACGETLAALPHVAPVLAGDRLVLLWVRPPAHVPPGLMEGSLVSDVRRAYPDATALTPPKGSYQFSGLLAVQGDRGYLFLHDGQVVQKVVVGETTYLRKLFDEGFGTC
jgi:hypothetical protein